MIHPKTAVRELILLKKEIKEIKKTEDKKQKELEILYDFLEFLTTRENSIDNANLCLKKLEELHSDRPVNTKNYT